MVVANMLGVFPGGCLCVQAGSAHLGSPVQALLHRIAATKTPCARYDSAISGLDGAVLPGLLQATAEQLGDRQGL